MIAPWSKRFQISQTMEHISYIPELAQVKHKSMIWMKTSEAKYGGVQQKKMCRGGRRLFSISPPPRISNVIALYVQSWLVWVHQTSYKKLSYHVITHISAFKLKGNISDYLWNLSQYVVHCRPSFEGLCANNITKASGFSALLSIKMTSDPKVGYTFYIKDVGHFL